MKKYFFLFVLKPASSQHQLLCYIEPYFFFITVQKSKNEYRAFSIAFLLLMNRPFFISFRQPFLLT